MQDNIGHKERYLHLRGADGQLLPQPISFGVYPQAWDVQLEAMSQLLASSEDPDEQATIKKAAAELAAIIAAQERYNGFFLPVTDGEWNEYVRTSTTDAFILARHLCDQEGKPLYTDEEAKFLKPRDFIKAGVAAITTESEITTNASHQAEFLVTRLLEDVKKLRARKLASTFQEMKTLKEAAEASTQGTSSPVTSDSDPGTKAASPE
jgi:hypothetical protein